MNNVKSKFTLHTEYIDFVPGKNQPEFPIEVLAPHPVNPGMQAVKSVLFLVLIISNVLLLVLFAYTQRINHLLLYEGQKVPATVTACEQLFDPKNKPNAIYTFTYTVSDQVYEGRASLPESCNVHPTGSSIEAIYHPSDPSHAMINFKLILSNEEAAGPVLFILCGSTLGLAFALWRAVSRLRPYLYARRHRRELATNSVLLKGKITAIKGYAPYKQSAHYVCVWYQFQAPNKTLLKGLGEAYREDLRGNLPAVGTPVTVLYATDGSHMIL